MVERKELEAMIGGFESPQSTQRPHNKE